MSVVLLLLPLLITFAFTSHPADAVWCACRGDKSDVDLQRSIDYACGNGADCAAINQGGACFQPNTVRAHCSYAVNSYYIKKGGAQGSCDFSGTAAVTSTDPSPGGSCSFTSGGGGGGVTVNPPTTPTPPGSSTPTGGSLTPPGSTTPTGGSLTPPGSSTFSPPGSFTPGNGGMTGGGGGFGTGLAPSGTGGFTDNAGLVLTNTNCISLLSTVWFSALLFLWV